VTAVLRRAQDRRARATRDRPVRALDLPVVAGVVVATLLGAILRFLWLGRQSLWLDEVVTWNLLRRSLPSLVRHGIPGSESTPPLYYVVAWCWVRASGWSAPALRSLSALAGTLTVPVAFLAGRSLAGVRAGLMSALLVAVSPILVWYSQEARAYALFALLAALSVWLFGRILEHGLHRDVAAWAVVCVLALATHYFAVFLVFAEAMWLARRLPRPVFLRAIAAPVAACVLLAPFVYAQRGHASGLSATSLSSRIGSTGAWFAAGDLHSPLAWAIVSVVALSACIAALRRHRVHSERAGGTTALGIALVATILPLALALIGMDYFFFRNLIAIWLLLAIAISAGFAGVRRHFLGIAATAILAIVFLVADATVWANPGQQRDNYRHLTGILDIRPRSVLIVYPGWDVTPLFHYDAALRSIQAKEISTREVDFVGVSSNYGAWVPPTKLRLRIPAGFRYTGRRIYQHFLVVRLSSIQARTLPLVLLQHRLVSPRGNTTAPIPAVRLVGTR
jgi:mannosyltransferase